MVELTIYADNQRTNAVTKQFIRNNLHLSILIETNTKFYTLLYVIFKSLQVTNISLSKYYNFMCI